MPTVPTLDVKPVRALAGAGDLAVERLRARVVSLPQDVTEATKRVSGLQEQVKTLPATVRSLQEQALEQAKALPSLAQSLPTVARQQADELPVTVRKQVDELAAKVTAVYSELAQRGEKVLRRESTTPAPAAKPVAKKAAKATPAVPTQSANGTVASA